MRVGDRKRGSHRLAFFDKYTRKCIHKFSISTSTKVPWWEMERKKKKKWEEVRRTRKSIAQNSFERGRPLSDREQIESKKTISYSGTPRTQPKNTLLRIVFFFTPFCCHARGGLWPGEQKNGSSSSFSIHSPLALLSLSLPTNPMGCTSL